MRCLCVNMQSRRYREVSCPWKPQRRMACLGIRSRSFRYVLYIARDWDSSPKRGSIVQDRHASSIRTRTRLPRKKEKGGKKEGDVIAHARLDLHIIIERGFPLLLSHPRVF
jgi:hypothetical protein